MAIRVSAAGAEIIPVIDHGIITKYFFDHVQKQDKKGCPNQEIRNGRLVVFIISDFLHPLFSWSAVAGWNTDARTRRGAPGFRAVSYTHLRAHETDSYLVCRLL